MFTGQVYSFWEFARWMRRDSYWLILHSSIPTILAAVFDWRWLGVPWVPIALIGTAAAFIVGFRNNATYGRLWEARQIWGGIVNVSRTWGMMVQDFVRAGGDLGEDEAKAARTSLVHRHVAWLTALRYQLRQPRAWEGMQLRHNIEYRDATYVVPELKGDLGAELAALLPAEEAASVRKKANPAVQLLALQGRALADLRDKGVFEANAHVALERVLSDLYEMQGRSERIKNFPYPRQFATINQLFVRLFTLLVPFGMIGELMKLGKGYVWLTILFSFLIGWVFNAMERVGQATENPFEGSPNDVPITSMSRTIEIDLREMLGETELPAPIPAVHNIQM